LANLKVQYTVQFPYCNKCFVYFFYFFIFLYVLYINLNPQELKTRSNRHPRQRRQNLISSFPSCRLYFNWKETDQNSPTYLLQMSIATSQGIESTGKRFIMMVFNSWFRQIERKIVVNYCYVIADINYFKGIKHVR